MTEQKDPAKVAAAYKGILGQQVTSQERELIPEDYKKWALNLFKFTAPILSAFFYQLSIGVPFSSAWPVAALALYGLTADLLNKWASETIYKESESTVSKSGK